MHANGEDRGDDPRGPLCVQPCAGADGTDQAGRLRSVETCRNLPEPVETPVVLHRRDPRRKRPSRAGSCRLPRRPHSLRLLREDFKGSWTRDSGRCDDDGDGDHRYRTEDRGRARRARREARHRLPRRLDPRHRAGALRDPALAPRAARSRSPPPTWSSRCGRRSRREVDGDGAVVMPGKPLVELARLLPASEVTIELPAGGGHRPDRLRGVQLAPARLQRGGLPAAAGGRRAAARDRPRGAARDGRPGRALGLAGRVAARPDRDPRPLRGRQARHGRHRLVPALGQGDGSSARRRRSSRRSSRPAR